MAAVRDVPANLALTQLADLGKQFAKHQQGRPVQGACPEESYFYRGVLAHRLSREASDAEDTFAPIDRARPGGLLRECPTLSVWLSPHDDDSPSRWDRLEAEVLQLERAARDLREEKMAAQARAERRTRLKAELAEMERGEAAAAAEMTALEADKAPAAAER